MDHELWPVLDRLPTGTTRIRCPYCADERRSANQSIRTFTVTIDQGIALYTCHHCKTSGRVKLDRDIRERIAHKPREARLPAPNNRSLTPAHIEYLKGRGISLETATKAGVYSIDSFIRDVGQVPCLAFPYASATKLRATHVKGFSSQGAANTLFLQELVVAGNPMVITEGEIDALSMMEAGIPNAVSAPNGAPAQASVTNGRISPKEDGKYKFVWSAQSLYKDCKKIVIATDSDEPGDALAEELARRIGKYRCYRVKFPAGLKDANDVLVKLGAEALRDLVECAEAWPVAGLFETTNYVNKVTDLFIKGQGRGISTGLQALDGNYTIAPGQFTIVTGIPSAGKSEFIDHLMVELAMSESWSFAVCSFENPPEGHIVKLLEKRQRAPFYNNGGTGDQPVNRITTDGLRDGLAWVSEHFYWMEQADGAVSTIDDIIERAKVAVMRYGVRGVVIDPYNYIDKPSNVAETEFVSETLTKIKQFAVGHDVHVWFIAHPTKLKRDETGGYPAPGGYEISGSAAWFAKADCGLTVHKGPHEYETEIHLWKVRFKWIGKTGMVMLAYDPVTGRYSDGRQPDTGPIILKEDEEVQKPAPWAH